MNAYLYLFLKKQINSVIFACTLAVIACFTPQVSDASGNKSEPEFHIDGRLSWHTKDGTAIIAIDIEIAETRARRARGLKNRQVPDFSHGMLFIYNNTAIRTFIMTDTPTSLDIIFIDENSRVINIHRQTRPMSEQTYRSSGPARYVVEVKAGFCDWYGIQPGMKIRRH